MIQTLVISDIHGDLDAYRSAIRRHGARRPSIQIGDLGIGHFSEREARDLESLHRGNPGRRFIRGNHDRVSLTKALPGWIADGTILGDVLFLGGAGPGQATQIPAHEMTTILARLSALDHKPRVVVSHDGPQSIAARVEAHRHAQCLDPVAPPQDATSRTRTFLSQVQQIVLPDLWIFGHCHEAWDGRDGPTFFRCMGFQESFVLPLPWQPFAEDQATSGG